MKSLFGIILLLSLYSCMQNSHTYTETLFLGHRGGGISLNPKEKPVENTLESVIYGKDFFRGFELDIQMSKDSVIWVYHDSDIILNTGEKTCIPNLTTEIIESTILKKKDAEYNICQLENILQFINKQDSNYYISLDVKGNFNNNCFETPNAQDEYFEVMATELIRLIDRYNLNNYVFIETDYIKFLNEIKKKNKSIKCFVLGYSNIDKIVRKASKNNFDGISFNIADTSLTIEDIEKAREKGLIIQLWTPNTAKELNRALSLKPDFIQTDNEGFYALIKK